MMGRFRVFAAMMAVVGIASGGCAEQSSPTPEPRPEAATPEATQHEAPSAGERALSRENERYRRRMAERAERFDARACEATRSVAPSAERSAWGDGGRAGGKEGLVAESYMAGDGHWILVEREPVCRTLCESRRGPCQGIELEISGSTVVLRGPGGRRPAGAPFRRRGGPEGPRLPRRHRGRALLPLRGGRQDRDLKNPLGLRGTPHGRGS